MTQVIHWMSLLFLKQRRSNSLHNDYYTIRFVAQISGGAPKKDKNY